MKNKISIYWNRNRKVFDRISFFSFLAGIGILSSCGSSQPQSTQAASPQPSPLRQLEARVKAMEGKQSRLIQLQAEVDALKSNIKDLEQIKSNQNLLILNLEGKFDERIAQIEKKLDQNNPRLRQQAGDAERQTENVPALSQKEKTAADDLQSGATVNSETASSGDVAISPSAPSAVNVDQVFETGWELHKKNQYLKAIEVFRKFRKDYPQHPSAIEAHFLIADSYFALEDYQNAAVEFFDFVEQNPQYPSTHDAQWKLAQSLEKSGEVGLALDIYQELAQGSSSFREEAQKTLERYEQK
ncbi:MAG: tetratricopeptide repeat protein [SAR324 cluster bacterium]|nr:tetratricopeptide repeat protein [SAR324 cluster bacterium]